MKRFKKGLLKNKRRIVAFMPNNIRLSFYLAPIGDLSTKTEFSSQDLDSITLLNEQTFINPSLFDQPINNVEGNIYALLDEGVLEGCPTGADLGIYNYQLISKPIKATNDYSKYINGNFSQSIDDDSVDETFFDTNDDYGFRRCVLADEDALNSGYTQVVITFKGYLEVTTGEFSFIRRCDCDNADFSVVYMPKDYVSKYQLRNGDEIVCTCKEVDGKMLLRSLFTINQQPRYQWNCDRPWFNALQNTKPKQLNGGGSYTKAIISKFKLFEGDNVFLYIDKTSQKNQILAQFMQELSEMFDKVIYINPKYKHSIDVGEGHNIVKFCSLINDKFNSQVTTTLLGVSFAKRLIEMGKKVAVVIDDIDLIESLDKAFAPECPVSKTMLSLTKVSGEGYGNEFAIVPLRTNNINSYQVNDLFKGTETLGIVIEYNEIDLFNSYRI